MSKLTKAFDAHRGVETSRPGIAVPVVAPKRRAMSIMQALHWAFGTECAWVDFDEQENPDAYIVGCDNIWRLMRMAELGCRVQGGGVSPAADDAEIIAAVTSRLPVAQGGRTMAAIVASHARNLTSPDWMAGAQPRCVPVAWFTNRHGTTAKTEVIRKEVVQVRGRKVQHDVLCCPVTFAPSSADIAKARRHYLAWWGALMFLRDELASLDLGSVEITRHMPPMQPWKVHA